MYESNPVWILVFLAVATGVYKIGKWVDRKDSDGETFNKFMDEVRDTLAEIDKNIKSIFLRLNPDVVKRGSPIQLTELGVRVSQSISATLIAEDIISGLDVDFVNMTDYELQEFATNYAQTKFNPEPKLAVLLSDCAFQEGIPIESVYAVIGIELRDKLIELKKVSATP